MELDLDAIRKESDEKMGPEWTPEQREWTWRAALALIGINRSDGSDPSDVPLTPPSDDREPE